MNLKSFVIKINSIEFMLNLYLLIKKPKIITTISEAMIYP
jgi:hypothetical protein